jgi:hypothetical protein
MGDLEMGKEEEQKPYNYAEATGKKPDVEKAILEMSDEEFERLEIQRKTKKENVKHLQDLNDLKTLLDNGEQDFKEGVSTWDVVVKNIREWLDIVDPQPEVAPVAISSTRIMTPRYQAFYKKVKEGKIKETDVTDEKEKNALTNGKRDKYLVVDPEGFISVTPAGEKAKGLETPATETQAETTAE